MEREIVKTDKRYRRKLFVSYLIAIFLGVIFWKWGFPLISDYIVSLPNRARIETLEIIEHVVLLLFIPAALYLIVIGRRVCRHQAMPYPGMSVIRDTVIVRGKKALLRGRCMVALGVVLIVMVITSMIATHLIMLHFKRHPLFRQTFYGTEV